jgi:tetratricopeptide (TPR) repeat protein
MLRARSCLYLMVSIAGATLFPAIAPARQSTGARDPSGVGGLEGMIPTASLDVYVQESSGASVESLAVVTLTTLAGRIYRQETTKRGYVRFNDLAATEYKIQVVAPAYERAVRQVEAIGFATKQVTIVLQPGSNSGDSALAEGVARMKPKAQKEMAKAMEALRANKPTVARSHLDAADRMAPNHAEVSYLFGVYAEQLNDEAQAKSYWTKTLQLNPKHFRALLSLSEIFVGEKKSAEAMEYLKRAIEAEPSSWRPHALLAEAHYLQHSRDEAIKEAERAMELGRGQAAIIQPLLAQCLAERGERDKAVSTLQVYLQDHVADAAAKKQLESLQNSGALVASSDVAGSTNETEISALIAAAKALPVPSSWMPPDVDDEMPRVEPGATCALEEVVQSAGKRLQELVKNVDRFTATELVTDESINKWGLASFPEKAQFDYIVSMAETRPGALSVEEYRERKTSSKGFPEAVRTSGLPAMVVIFHPIYADNYEMTCEGLARWNGGLAWQVHFRQRKDKPNTIRSYRMGLEGQGYPVALKGRAWIAADSYQIVRLETSMVAPIPQIRLAAEHVNIDYAPVQFRKGALEMWLPASAEVYYDWKGRRVHRQHKFINYLLFSVEDKQKISAPKGQDAAPPDSEKLN